MFPTLNRTAAFPLAITFSGLTTTFVPLLPIQAIQSGIPQRFGMLFRAGIDVSRIRHFNARQARSYWCWAADVQMILAYYGITTGQDEIVARLFGAPVNLPGGPTEVLAALNALAFVDGHCLQVEATSLIKSPFDVLSDLLEDRPLLVGLRGGQGVGHAYVLSAVSYEIDPFGAPIFRSVTLHDPWPFNPDMKEMSWAEFCQACSLLVRVRVREAGLQ